MTEPEPNLQPYQVALSIGQKISCSLSIIGSLMIISQVCRNKVNRSKCQQRLILGISLIDFNTSVHWLFTSLFVPPSSSWLDSGNLLVWNASGNEATCNAQGFTNQFMIAGVLYMVSLQIQYMLVIKHGWKEKMIRKVEPYMHVLPICFGLGTAITGLVMKLYNPATWHCWIAPLPDDCTPSYEIKRGNSDLEQTDCIRGDNARIYQWAMFFVPLWVAILCCIFAMMRVIKSVEKVEKKATRWNRFSKKKENGRSTKKEQAQPKPKLTYTAEVRKQSMMYAGTFFFVWTLPTIARLIQLINGEIPPLLSVFTAWFVASQGFFNALIYFRPRYMKCEKDRVWEKVWFILQSTIFFCVCYEKGNHPNNDITDVVNENDDFVVENGGSPLGVEATRRKLNDSNHIGGESLAKVHEDAHLDGFDEAHNESERDVHKELDEANSEKPLVVVSVDEEKQEDD